MFPPVRLPSILARWTASPEKASSRPPSADRSKIAAMAGSRSTSSGPLAPFANIVPVFSSQSAKGPFTCEKIRRIFRPFFRYTLNRANSFTSQPPGGTLTLPAGSDSTF